jgi:hypothetical protein
MELDGARGDPLARLALGLGATLHPVGACLVGHVRPSILTPGSPACIFVRQHCLSKWGSE